MTDTETLCYRSVHALAGDIRRREISPVEVVRRIPGKNRRAESPPRRLSHGHRGCSARRSEASRSRNCQGGVARAAARHPVRRKRHLRNGGRSNHARLELLLRLRSCDRCRSGQAPARGRSDHARQDADARIRGRHDHHQSALRHGTQSVESRSHHRRVEWRIALRRSRLGSARSHSGPIQADRSATRQRCAGSWGSSRRTAA